MADSSQKHDLREISHLFLSGVRDRQTGNAPRPQRIPPSGRAEQPVELTGEELARVSAAASAAQPVASVTAVLAAHLEQRQGECVRQYASHVAAGGGRVGLIEVDACEFRLSIFERNPQGSPQPTHDAASPIDARRISESLEELSWEVDRWILCIGGGNRVPEARDLLRRAGRFALLSSCDPDGIVAAYRTLKGTADIVRRETWPPLSLAVFDASDANHAAGTFEKLSGVAMQFLSWPIEMDSQVEPADRVAEHLVLNCRATHEKSQTCAAPHLASSQRLPDADGLCGSGTFINPARRAGCRAASDSSPVDAGDVEPGDRGFQRVDRCPERLG